MTMVALVMWMVCLFVPAQQGEFVSLIAVDGTVTAGTWEETLEIGRVALRRSDGTVHAVAADDILDVQLPLNPQAEVAFKSWPHAVHWRNGTVVPGRFAEDGGHVDTPWGTVAVDPRALRAVHWRQHDCAAALARELATDGSSDVLLTLRDGVVARFAGTIESVNGTGGTFTHQDRTVPFGSDRVGAVVLAAGATPSGSTCLQLAGDWQVCGTLAGTTATAATIAVTADARLTVPLDQMTAIRCASKRVTYLDDLEPQHTVQRSFFDVQWPMRRKRSVTNGPLLIRGQRFERGLGVHAHSELTYRVPAGCHTFAATVGIDDAAAPQGEVMFRVVTAAGEQVVGPLGRGDAGQIIQVDVTGSTTLQLIVEQAGGLDVGDQADWALARFVR